MLEVKMLSIGEVARRSGLRPSALRYYEEAGLVAPAARVSGRRHYDASVLDRLRVIACAQDAGFTIAEVRELLRGEDEPPARWRALAERKLREVDAVIEKALATRRLLEESLRCNCVALQQCVSVLRRTSDEGLHRRAASSHAPQRDQPLQVEARPAQTAFCCAMPVITANEGVRDGSATAQRRDVDAGDATGAGAGSGLATDADGYLAGSSAAVDQLVDRGAASGAAKPANAPPMRPPGPTRQAAPPP